ncbi:MAG: hypothetical protein V1867_07045 [Candidatus Falkowbacteria bacterium]
MKRIISVFAVAAIVIGVVSPMAPAAAAGILNGLNGAGNIGDLFALDRLFNVGDDAQTNLGDLFILDQLFPQQTAVAVAPIPLRQQLAGRILIQTEAAGRAWYVNPADTQRYYLNGPQAALTIMGEQATGITNANFDAFGGTAPSRLAGKFLLKVEDSGKLYYVNPTDRNIVPVIGAAGAFNLIEDRGLGITNANIEQIPVAPGSLAVN